MNDADPWGEWLVAHDRTAPQQGRAPLWSTWARVYLGIAVMSFTVGVIARATPGAGALVIGWLVATAIGLDVTTQTLDQTEDT